ncbi:MAG TPA: hypothetical protein PKW50_04340 [Syntrophomonas sp.]|nr:hypothetical protein [Syntrophomonas sp.]
MKKEKAIKGGTAGCLNCGYTESLLPMRTRLYSSMGGWMITKDGELYYMENNCNRKWERLKTMITIEKQAKKEPDSDWRAIFESPLRGAEYQRQGKSKWVLISKNNGYA